MGAAASEARDCFAQLVVHASDPCSLTAFANRAEVLGSSLRTPAQVRDLRLPQQGQTDISGGVGRCLDTILELEAREPGVVHHVLFLLSDGAHNVGPTPAHTFPRLGMELRAKTPHLRLSMVVVGITASSRTCDGMLGRSELETVPLHGLEPIYFAQSARDMSRTLDMLEAGISVLTSGRVVGLELEREGPGGFVRVPGEAPVQRLDVFVPKAGVRPSIVVSAEEPPDAIVFDGARVPVVAVGFDDTAAAAAVQTLIGALRERRVGKQRLDEAAALDFLEPCISAVEEYQASFVHIADGGGSRPMERVHRHKALITALHGARHLRNQLAEAVAFSSNDSVEQAEFLTGAAKKYGAKALRRAVGTGHARGFDACLNAVAHTGRKLRAALRRDLLAHLGRLSPEQLEVVACAGGVAEPLLLQEVVEAPRLLETAGYDGVAVSLDDERLVVALRAALGDAAAPVSYLSLLSQWEQLAEWAAHASEPAQIVAAGVTSEYELLMFVGMLGFPVQVSRWSGTQMDPFQMSISAVHAAPVDTASLCCALQSGQPVSAPEGGEVKDLLLLVDPDCPEASSTAMMSPLFDLYTSVVLCRDLHMYTGLPMRVALHSHALFAIIGANAPTEAELGIALRICYSVRKIWQSEVRRPKQESAWECNRDKYEALFHRLRDWEELTTADGVSDPSELFLAMGALCDDEGVGHATAPPAVLMAVNEALARRARGLFRSKAGGEAHTAKVLAAECVRGFLGIREDSAPLAQEADEAEPPRAEVEAACERDVDLDRQAFDFHTWALEGSRPVLRAFALVDALSGALRRRGGGWRRLEADLEAGPGAYADVLADLRRRPAELPEACDFEAHRLEVVLAAMAAQAMLCSDSGERRHLPDVREGETLSLIAVRLRMETYAGHVAVKMQDWRAVALDVTAARARAADIGQFAAMLGSHAHGLSKGAFWGLWHAAQHDGYGGAKVRAFLASANECFATKHGSADCAVASVRKS
jgi:hypothetical protein